MADSLPDQSGVLWTKEPGFTAGRVQVSVSPEERLVSPRLVPAHKQLWSRRLEEPANVSYVRGEGLLVKSEVQSADNKPLQPFCPFINIFLLMNKLFYHIIKRSVKTKMQNFT